MIYDVYHNCPLKSRLFLYGRQTNPSFDGVYAGAVSLSGTSVVTFLLQVNQQELWVNDVWKSYVEATTNEKSYIFRWLELRSEQAIH